jgi:hypothetical protein
LTGLSSTDEDVEVKTVASGIAHCAARMREGRADMNAGAVDPCFGQGVEELGGAHRLRQRRREARVAESLSFTTQADRAQLRSAAAVHPRPVVRPGDAASTGSPLYDGIR